MQNIPSVKVGIVVGSTDWMPADIAIEKRKKLVSAYVERYGETDIYEVSICLNDNEINIKRVMKELVKAECNALCLYWANYGPESAGTMLADQFDGPVMMIGAAEESEKEMGIDRADALSGFINACYALNLRKTRVHIPNRPIGTVDQSVNSIAEFIRIARAYLAIQNLKVISIGPRPTSYLASQVPVYPLYELGISVDECSELEIFDAYNKHSDDVRISKVKEDILEELNLSESSEYIEKYAQYEVTLNDWIRGHKGNSKYIAMTSTCWPAFPVNFGFVPCYVNSRLTGKGIPVACEVDVYGAVSEYIGQSISDSIVTLLNINNNLPRDTYEKNIANEVFEGKKYKQSDVFIGYHCGVSPSQKLVEAKLKPHFVNNLLIGEEKSQGTLHGRIVSGPVTLFRLQSTIDGELIAYIAQGHIMPVDAKTYGGYAVIAVPEMERFVRNVILEKHFPNHTAIIFGHYGSELLSLLKMIGIQKVYYSKSENEIYENENIFSMND